MTHFRLIPRREMRQTLDFRDCCDSVFEPNPATEPLQEDQGAPRRPLRSDPRPTGGLSARAAPPPKCCLSVYDTDGRKPKTTRSLIFHRSAQAWTQHPRCPGQRWAGMTWPVVHGFACATPWWLPAALRRHGDGARVSHCKQNHQFFAKW